MPKRQRSLGFGLWNATRDRPPTNDTILYHKFARSTSTTRSRTANIKSCSRPILVTERRLRWTDTLANDTRLHATAKSEWHILAAELFLVPNDVRGRISNTIRPVTCIKLYRSIRQTRPGFLRCRDLTGALWHARSRSWGQLRR